MKRLMMFAMLAAVAVAFAGCKKEETLGDKLDKAVESSETEAKKTEGDIQKALDGALKK